MTLRLYDTMTRAKRVFEPLDPKRVRVYVCGPTVYDFAHIGNARPVVVFDVLFRLLRHLFGPEHVTYARNITDVDDKIIRAAQDSGEAIDAITQRTADRALVPFENSIEGTVRSTLDTLAFDAADVVIVGSFDHPIRHSLIARDELTLGEIAAAFRTLLGLLEGGDCWVKVSAPYETSRQGPPLYGDVGALAKALIAAAPERMVWASNWPHPTALDDPPDDAVLLDLLLEWTEDEALRRRILTDNPAALYGFASSSA